MPALIWLRRNWLAVGLVFGLGLGFILLKNSPTEGIDSLQSLDSVVSTGQPTIIKFYSNFWTTCLLAKPIVDGVERQLGGKAKVIRLDVFSSIGRQAAARYGVRATPTVIVTDGNGQAVYRLVGLPQSKQLIEQVEALLASR